MEYHGLLNIIHAGKTVKCDVYTSTRGGSKSPKTYYLKLNNRWITPYEQRVRGYHMTLNTLFSVTYGNLIRKMAPQSNYFIQNILKEK